MGEAGGLKSLSDLFNYVLRLESSSSLPEDWTRGVLVATFWGPKGGKEGGRIVFFRLVEK